MILKIPGDFNFLFSESQECHLRCRFDPKDKIKDIGRKISI